jgi:hypothetical protein
VADAVSKSEKPFHVDSYNSNFLLDFACSYFVNKSPKPWQSAPLEKISSQEITVLYKEAKFLLRIRHLIKELFAPATIFLRLFLE